MATRRAFLVIAMGLALVPANAIAQDQRTYRHLPGATCAPLSIGPGDQLVINLPAEHGRELIVVDPLGDEVHLTYNRVASGRAFPNLVTETNFMSLRRVELKIDTLQGFNYYDFKLGPVFKANGRFRFVLMLLDKYGYLEVVPLCSVNYRNPKDLNPPPKPRKTYFGADPY